jgi:hypothetical protein
MKSVIEMGKLKLLSVQVFFSLFEVLGFDSWWGAGNFSLHHCVKNGSGAHPASYPMGTWASSLGIKWPGHEPDHSLPSTAKVIE